jgi:hypothetical protein
MVYDKGKCRLMQLGKMPPLAAVAAYGSNLTWCTSLLLKSQFIRLVQEI